MTKATKKAVKKAVKKSAPIRLTASDVHEAYNRGYRTGEQDMERAKLGGIADLQEQLNEARKSAVFWHERYKRLATALMNEVMQ